MMYGVSLLVAACCFAWTFAIEQGNFWVKITVTVLVLCCLALAHRGFPMKGRVLLFREVLIGIGAASVLYGIFWLGDFCAAQLFGFAPKQVEAIYAIRQLGHPWVVGLILFCVTSPGEEFFWRGYVLREAMARWGEMRGMAFGIAVYGGVHLPSGNFMLVMAALVAGIFWCFLYRWRKGDLTACVVSHALWTVGVFLIFPIRG